MTILHAKGTIIQHERRGGVAAAPIFTLELELPSSKRRYLKYLRVVNRRIIKMDSRVNSANAPDATHRSGQFARVYLHTEREREREFGV